MRTVISILFCAFAFAASAYPLTISAVAEPETAGDVSYSPGSGVVASGETFTISATERDPYQMPFKYWLSSQGRYALTKDAEFPAINTVYERWTAKFGPEGVITNTTPDDPYISQGPFRVTVSVAPDSLSMGACEIEGETDQFFDGDVCTIVATPAGTNTFLYWRRTIAGGYDAQVFQARHSFQVHRDQEWQASFGDSICRIEIFPAPPFDEAHCYWSDAKFVAGTFNQNALARKASVTRRDGVQIDKDTYQRVAYVKRGTMFFIASEHETDFYGIPRSQWIWGRYLVIDAINLLNGRRVRVSGDDEFLRAWNATEDEKWMVHFRRWDDDRIIRGSSGNIWRNPDGKIEHVER